MKELMKKAHQMTKEIKREYPDVNYKFQLGLCLSFLASKGVEEDMIKITTEKGAKIELKLEGRTITDLYVNGVEVLKNNSTPINCFLTEDKIIINDKDACHKVSKRDVVYIANNEELKNLYRKAIEEERIEKAKKDEESKASYERLAAAKIKAKNAYTFDKHMNDINVF
jgi:hypothetical protein